VLRPRLESSDIVVTIDGSATDIMVWSDMSALEALRLATGRSQFRSSCEMGLCGTCEVTVDGAVTRVCSIPAIKLHGSIVVSEQPGR
jgi:aerobic-type carbon monoxide dehydrogenase small subunit (CoxS/CutS family)